MKLFKSSILAILGLAIGLTSCSDEKYVAGETGPGAYFAQGSMATMNCSPEGTSFKVPVMRTNEGPLTYSLSSMDESGLFSIPTSVTFDGNSTVTDLVISYDNTKLVEGQPYEISLIIDSNFQYGGSTLNLTVVMQPDMVSESFGIGTYYYGSTVMASIVNSSIDPDLPMLKAYMPNNPDKNIIYTIEHWAVDTDLNIEMPDATEVYDDGTITVFVPEQNTGYIDDENGRLCITDAYNFFMNNGMPAQAENAKDMSFFDPATGTFYLYVFYNVPDYVDEDGQGGYAYGDFGYQTFQLDGYPDNSISVTYDGLFTNRDQEMTARATIECGADVAKVGAIMVEGNDVEAALNAVLEGGSDVQEFTGAEVINASFEVTVGGQYTIVAVSYDEAGDAAEYDSDTFDIIIGVDPDAENWNPLGLADFADGWVIPAFSIENVQLEPLDWAFSIPVQQYVGEEYVEGALYRLVNPYGKEHPLTEAGLNAYQAKRNIEFHVLDSFAGILPQLSGFGASNWGGEMTIGTIEGYYMDKEGFSLEVVASVLKADEEVAWQTCNYEDGTLEVPLPIWGYPNNDGDRFGYNWKSYKSAYIFMPDVDSQVRAKIKARNVAAPKITGLSLKANRAKKAGNVSDFHGKAKKANKMSLRKVNNTTKTPNWRTIRRK